ncbi:S41 family peptidase [Hymenobacter cellulosivorans]|uniref:S41 family peptidase n=1 Tax=Hymenobacter cellulosivorans TaxID=2932249 RepID=A0ABY4F7P0_9BACT|nr:S41 family peptidase [Hymenobacter cellulosivorans]UOQ52038.1 S41 family peptidase [Hymenobacter cellulosivorans]
MKTTIWPLLLVLLLGAPRMVFSQDEPAQRQLTVEQQQTDFRLFRAALEQVHPGVYRYTPKARFDALFDSVYGRLQAPLSEQAYYAMLTPLMVQLRCGHTKFIPAQRDDKYPYHTSQLFPLRLHLLGGRAYALYAYDGRNIVPPGAEILQINGRPVGDILTGLLPYVSFADGATTTAKWLELDAFFAGYYAAFGQAADRYTVQYRQPDGRLAQAELPATTLATIKAVEKQRAPAPRYPVRLEFLPNDVATLTIDHFWVGEQEEPFEKFLASAFRQLRARGTKALILDVRNNEGGMDGYGSLLYSYLARQPFSYYSRITTHPRRVAIQEQVHSEWFYGIYRHLLISRAKDGTYEYRHRQGLKRQQPQKKAFVGDVYVLTNGWSFSATAEFATAVRAQGRATFIGQETGGAAGGDNSGFFAFVNLPHSGITMGLPVWSYYMAQPGSHPERGIIPDYVVEPTAADVLSGTDPEMQLAQDLIRKKAEAAARQ